MLLFLTMTHLKSEELKGIFMLMFRVFIWSKIHEWWQVSETLCRRRRSDTSVLNLFLFRIVLKCWILTHLIAQSYYVNCVSHIGTFNFVAIGGGNQTQWKIYCCACKEFCVFIKFEFHEDKKCIIIISSSQHVLT